ncbi:MAG: hypothetical protein AB1894_21410 [Chloroflexota bacterium]
MSTNRRILIAVILILVLAGVVIGVDLLQRATPKRLPGTAIPLSPGSVPIYLNGELTGGFAPADLENLEQVSFTDAEEGKLQDGWLLREVMLLYVPANKLKPEAQIVISSSSRNKSIQLTWAEVNEQANMVMFDLSNRGTLKLVSLLPQLDRRDEWVQDVDRIEVTQP